MYLIPNFQNPTGRRIPLGRRTELLQRAQRTGLLLVEDDPYGELSYDGTRVPSLLSFDRGQVVRVGSFSKILAPGLRVGYVIAPPELHRKLVALRLDELDGLVGLAEWPATISPSSDMR